MAKYKKIVSDDRGKARTVEVRDAGDGFEYLDEESGNWVVVPQNKVAGLKASIESGIYSPVEDPADPSSDIYPSLSPKLAEHMAWWGKVSPEFSENLASQQQPIISLKGLYSQTGEQSKFVITGPQEAFFSVGYPKIHGGVAGHPLDKYGVMDMTTDPRFKKYWARLKAADSLEEGVELFGEMLNDEDLSPDMQNAAADLWDYMTQPYPYERGSNPPKPVAHPSELAYPVVTPPGMAQHLPKNKPGGFGSPFQTEGSLSMGYRPEVGSAQHMKAKHQSKINEAKELEERMARRAAAEAARAEEDKTLTEGALEAASGQ